MDLLGEHVQRVRVALWGFLRGLLAALDHALDPCLRHSLLALQIQRGDVVLAAPTPTELWVEPVGAANADLRPSRSTPSAINRLMLRCTFLPLLHVQLGQSLPDSW